MHWRGDELEVNAGIVEKCFESPGLFIVQTMKVRPESVGNQARVEFLKSGKDARACATAHGLHEA